MLKEDMQTMWIPCPDCGGNTRTKVRADTQMYHHLIFCPRCKKEYLVNVERFTVTLIKESDAETQRRKAVHS